MQRSHECSVWSATLNYPSDLIGSAILKHLTSHQSQPPLSIQVYHGAPNIDEYLPQHNAVLHYSDYGSPEKLMDEMVRR